MAKKALTIASLIIVLLGLLPPVAGLARPSQQAGITPEPFPFSDRYPVEVLLISPEEVDLLIRSGVDIGNVRPLGPGHPSPRPGGPFEPLLAVAYVNDAEFAELQQQGLIVWVIPNESMRAFRAYGPGTHAPPGWPTFEEFVARMQTLANDYPSIVRMVSIGQSVQGRDIWMLKLSDSPDQEEDEPEFRYVSTMHGNEPVGTEMTIRLAELLAGSYGSDPGLTKLVDEMEIWLCPIYNPDGYVAGSRYNAHGKDLNRNFPDRITDPYDDPAGREPETQATMYFVYGQRFVMGANYHTGALVVNYPWDSVDEQGPPDYAPDDAIFYDYSIGYAIRNPMIWSAPWPGPVIRGWEWYIIYGGMQDWAYHWQGEHHVTIEISEYQPPPYDQMDTYWDDNREAMLWWMERTLNGARGLVTDAATGAPLDATVDIVQIGKVVRTDPDVGDYHRLLLPGTYTLTCSAPGYLDQSWGITVISGTATIQNCAMQRNIEYGVIASDSTVVGAPGETVTHTVTITNVGNVTDTYETALTPGSWPAQLLDTQVGPLAPLESGQAHVTVAIPAQLLASTVLFSDVFSLQVTSVASPTVGAQAIGTTYAVVDLGVALGTSAPSQTGLAGHPITYTVVVTNSGSYTDSYSLALSGNAWPAEITPSQTPPLGPGAVAEAGVRVELPAGPGSLTDTVTVTGRSGWDAQVQADLALLSRRVWGGVQASDSVTSGAPGQTVTHTLLITNTGLVTDTYVITLTGGQWPSTLLETTVGPLAPDTAEAVRVRVEIPFQPLVATVLLSDVFSLLVSSTTMPEVGAQATGTTFAVADLTVTLAADSPSRSALGGGTVTYTLVVTNSGTYTDSYSLTLAGGSWPVAILPVQTTPLAPGSNAEVRVQVTIPAGPPGQTDLVTVRASSSWNAAVYAEQELVTRRSWGVFLPALLRAVSGH